MAALQPDVLIEQRLCEMNKNAAERVRRDNEDEGWHEVAYSEVPRTPFTPVRRCRSARPSVTTRRREVMRVRWRQAVWRWWQAEVARAGTGEGEKVQVAEAGAGQVAGRKDQTEDNCR